MKKVFIFIIVLVIALIGFLARFEIYDLYAMRNYVKWGEKDISFEDFLIKPNEESELNMNYWHGIRLKEGMFNTEAVAVFDMSKSWIKDTLNFNFKEELQLQKLSFDLAEAYARKINNKIKILEYNNYNQQLPFEELEKECYPLYLDYERKFDLINNDYKKKRNFRDN